MNILLINDYLEGGGAESVFRKQYEILRECHQVELFYAFERIADTKITPLGYIYSTFYKRKLKTFLHSRQFDIIILHNYSSVLSPSVLDVLADYKKEFNCRLVYYAHDFHLLCPNRGYAYFQQGRMMNFSSNPLLREMIFLRLDHRGSLYSALKKIQWIAAYTIGKKQRFFDVLVTPGDFLASHILKKYPSLSVKRVYNPCEALENRYNKTSV